MNTFSKLTLVSAIALCSAGLPAAAMAAAPGSDVSEVRVSTADLDLSTSRGVARLRQRLRVAAMSVCMDADTIGSALSESVRTCRIEAAQRAKPAMESVIREAEAKKAVSVEASIVPR